MCASSPSAPDLLDEGDGHLATGELEAAAACYRRSIEIDPQFFEGWHALGMALMKIGQLKEAAGAAMMATELQPNDLLAWTALSQIHVKAGNIAEAEAAKANARILSLGGRVVKEAIAKE